MTELWDTCWDAFCISQMLAGDLILGPAEGSDDENVIRDTKTANRSGRIFVLTSLRDQGLSPKAAPGVAGLDAAQERFDAKYSLGTNEDDELVYPWDPDQGTEEEQKEAALKAKLELLVLCDKAIKLAGEDGQDVSSLSDAWKCFAHMLTATRGVDGVYEALEQHYPAYAEPAVKERLEAAHESKLPKAEVKRGGCYVATAVYGSYDCPQVWTLRRYRDDRLARTWYGRAFIQTYYAVSPLLVRRFGHSEWFKALCRSRLDRMVSKLQAHGVQSTPYDDRVW